MSKVLVTQELFNKMNFDMENVNLNNVSTATDSSQPSVLIVFANSDINAALYNLNKSLAVPFNHTAIASVFVQESIKEDFVGKFKQLLKSYTYDEVKSMPYFDKALATAKKLNANVITVEKQDTNVYTPTLVADFTHEQLGALLPSGIVTLHTFRTAKEALSLIAKESLKFTSVSIWHENHGYAYELIAGLKSSIFYINCYQVPLSVLKEHIKQGKNYVSLDKSYHYETLQHDGIQKSIVFPIGSIFAN